jgi:hypothetical protein
MDPRPEGYNPYAGFMQPDDEEERKKRMAAAGLGVPGFGPGLNAPASIAGTGAMAASMLPGGLWGGGAYSGVAGMPRNVPDQAAQAQNDVRGDLPGLAPSPALGGSVQTLNGTAEPGNWYSGWGTKMANAGSTLPAGAAGATGGSPKDQIRQLFLDQQANAPNMGGDAANRMLGAQVGILPETMQGQTARDVAQMNNEARLKEAALKFHPDAMQGQTLLTLLGALGGSGRLDATSIQQALAASKEVRSAFPGSSVAGSYLNLGGPNQSMTVDKGGAPGPAQPSLADLSKIDQFMSSNAAVLPADMQFGGAIGVDHKIIPGAKGGIQQFSQQHAAPLMKAMADANLPPDAIEAVLNRIQASPAGANVKKALIQQAAQDEMAAHRSANPNAPSRWGVPLDPQGQVPGTFTLAGTPFNYLANRFSNLGTTPYGKVQLKEGPEMDIGADNPVGVGGNYSNPINPFSQTQAELDRARELRRSKYPSVYKAFGLGLR